MVDLQTLDQRAPFPRRPEPLTGAAHFYHTMDVPGRGSVTGFWDLRSGLEAYLGRVDYAGCSVLEIGPAQSVLHYTITATKTTR